MRKPMRINRLLTYLEPQIIKFILASLIFSLVIPSFAFSFPEITIKQLLSNPDAYDQKTIKVMGEVTNLKFKISKNGYPYTIFFLTDKAGNVLRVFMWEHWEVNNGDMVSITGVFQKVKRVGIQTFYNEIEGGSIRKIR